MTDSSQPAASPGSRLPAAGELLLGKYRVDRVLGRGGMGVVMAAYHEALDQRVAIKLLAPGQGEQGEIRFVREAQAAARLESAHVVRVLDVGALDGGAPYMVMEYLAGDDLARELQRSGPLAPSVAADYVLQALDAIAEAHHLGIVHRDLKPANLFLVERNDGSRLVKVLDFGISKVETGKSTDLHLTSSQSMMGSPLYMSPEQVRSAKHVDSRSDLWALGVILHELLAGQAPFRGETMGEVFAAVLQGPAPPLRSIRPELPEGLEKIVLKCLEKGLSERFQSAHELAVALAPFASARFAPLLDRIASVHAHHQALLPAYQGLSASLPLPSGSATTSLDTHAAPPILTGGPQTSPSEPLFFSTTAVLSSGTPPFLPANSGPMPPGTPGYPTGGGPISPGAPFYPVNYGPPAPAVPFDPPSPAPARYHPLVVAAAVITLATLGWLSTYFFTPRAFPTPGPTVGAPASLSSATGP